MIRDARLRDIPAIHALTAAAFGREEEAVLVDRLRADGDALVELVVQEDDALLAHILFSALAVERPGETVRTAALAPVSVIPGRQKEGMGGALIRAGIERCRAFGLKAVILLGHPAYYPRFGFSPALTESLDAPFSGPAFMALELEPGVLAAGGKVRFAAAFGV